MLKKMNDIKSYLKSKRGDSSHIGVALNIVISVIVGSVILVGVIGILNNAVAPGLVKSFAAQGDDGLCTASFNESNFSCVLGDADKDGEVTSVDLLYIYNGLHGDINYPIDKDICDYNKDGYVDQMDIDAISLFYGVNMPDLLTGDMIDGIYIYASFNNPNAKDDPSLLTDGDMITDVLAGYNYIYSSGSWGVTVTSNMHSSYGIICDNVLGINITSLANLFSYCDHMTASPEIPDTVTDLYNTYYGCTSLILPPEIPNNITNMEETFSGCTALTTAPEIPDKVTDMSYTFYSCSSLTAAPEIPDSVTDMEGTFWGCSTLTAAPEIPNKVTNMKQTFYNCTAMTTGPSVIPDSVTNMGSAFAACTKLAGTITINANPTVYSGCFYYAGQNNGTTPITITGASTILLQLADTKGPSGRVVVG